MCYINLALSCVFVCVCALHSTYVSGERVSLERRPAKRPTRAEEKMEDEQSKLPMFTYVHRPQTIKVHSFRICTYVRMCFDCLMYTLVHCTLKHVDRLDLLGMLSNIYFVHVYIRTYMCSHYS